MTAIQKLQKEQQEKLKEYISEQDSKTIAAFQVQKDNLAKLAWTEWFKAIQRYWLEQEMLAIDLLWNKLDADDAFGIAEAKARYKLAKWFNQYTNIRLR